MNLSILRNKNFVLLVFGQFVSLIGTLMQNMAFSLYVLKLTGSGKIFASVLAIQILPRIILGPICGVLVDWFDKKKIIVALDFLSGLLIAFMYIISITIGLKLVHIYITVTLLSLISAMFNPAIPSIIPTIMKKDELIHANSIFNLAYTVGSIVAPLLAGVLYGMFGIKMVLLINSISFIGSAISEMFISVPKIERKNIRPSYSQFKLDFIEGISFIKNTRILLILTICALMMNFVLNPIFSVGITYISKMVIKISDIQYGLLESIAVGGTLLAPFLVSIFAKKYKLVNIFLIGISTCTVIIGIIAINASPLYLDNFNGNTIPFISLIVTISIFSLVLTVSNLAMMTLQQQLVKPEIMGRYYAVTGALGMAATPLGQIIFGALFDTIPSYLVVLLGFGIISISIILIAKAIKKCTCDEAVNSTQKVAEIEI